MGQITKDFVEASKSEAPASAPAPAASPKQSSGHLRSDALSLEIPVKVHGSRVTEVVRGVTPHTEPFEEQTSTMIVFPQGAVLRMATSVAAGQMLVVTNAKSRQDAICRVVKVRTFSKSQGYVEIEFTHAQPGYWGVSFPGETSHGKPATVAPSPAAAPVAAAPPPSPPVEKPSPEPPKHADVSDVSWAPARLISAVPPSSPPAGSLSAGAELKKPVAPPAVSPRPAATSESSFISIGSQEEVQPSAAPTLKAADRARLELEAPVAKKSAPIDFPAAPPTAQVPSLSMAELLGDEESTATVAANALQSEVAPQAEKSTGDSSLSTNRPLGTFGTFMGGGTLTRGPADSSESLAARLELGLGSADESEPREKNWLLIAACVALAFAGVVAGILYVRQHMAARAIQASPAAAIQPAAAPNPRAPVQEPGVSRPAPETEHLPDSGRAASLERESKSAPIVVTPETSSVEKKGESAGGEALQPETQTKQPAPSVTSDMVAATLNAHPISSQRPDENSTVAAPTIDVGSTPGQSPSVPAISTSSNMPTLAVPDARPAGPIRVGGSVKAPKLVSYHPPIYPMMAKESHVQGDVVVDTEIDKEGHVIHMKVVSGPMLLRQAALDALQSWRYEPSKLDGQPVAVQMLVTIQFRF